MTQYYLLTEDDHEVRELSHGRVPERIREMAKTLLDWETEETLRKRAAEKTAQRKSGKGTRRPTAA